MPDTVRNTWADVRSSFKDEQRRAISTAALAILMEEGSPGLTMAGLADRAGISRQTLYRYFPDLDSVLTACVDGLTAADAQFRDQILSDGTPQDHLHRIIDALIDADEHGGGRIEEFLAALPPDARAAVHEHRHRSVELVHEILSALQAEPRSRYDGDPTVDAGLIFGLISSANQKSRERTHRIVDLILDPPDDARRNPTR